MQEFQVHFLAFHKIYRINNNIDNNIENNDTKYNNNVAKYFITLTDCYLYVVGNLGIYIDWKPLN